MLFRSCSLAEFDRFIDGSKDTATGWVGFYWGHRLEDLRRSKEIKDALVLAWLEWFEKNGKKRKR